LASTVLLTPALTALLALLTKALLVLLTPALLALLAEALLILLTELALLTLLTLLAELALLAERAGRHRIAVDVDEDLLAVRGTRLQHVFIHALDLLEAGLAKRVLDLLALLTLLTELLTRLAEALLVLLTELLAGLAGLPLTIAVLILTELASLAELLARLAEALLVLLTEALLVLLTELLAGLPLTIAVLILTELTGLAGLAGLPLAIAVLILTGLLRRLTRLPALRVAILVVLLREGCRRGTEHESGGNRENGLACHEVPPSFVVNAGTSNRRASSTCDDNPATAPLFPKNKRSRTTNHSNRSNIPCII
jgi:hypothetical protein